MIVPPAIRRKTLTRRRKLVMQRPVVTGLAVIRLVVIRLAVIKLAVTRLAVTKLAVIKLAVTSKPAEGVQTAKRKGSQIRLVPVAKAVAKSQAKAAKAVVTRQVLHPPREDRRLQEDLLGKAKTQAIRRC